MLYIYHISIIHISYIYYTCGFRCGCGCAGWVAYGWVSVCVRGKVRVCAGGWGGGGGGRGGGAVGP